MRASLVLRMATALLASLPAVAQLDRAQAQSPALTGKVVSDREGPMEGVLVSAKKERCDHHRDRGERRQG